jgi:hypothetical protein
MTRYEITVFSLLSDCARFPAMIVPYRTELSHKTLVRRPLRQPLRENLRLYGLSLKGCTGELR